MSEISLPENLPPSWLEQIRKAVAPKTSMVVLSTLLGSSVIAALVGFGSSYVMQTRNANTELEKTRVAERRQSLQTLSNHLSVLNVELGNIPNASQLGGSPKLRNYAKKS